MRTSASISTDHSTSDQDFQCKELLRQLEPLTLLLRDSPREELHNNSSSMEPASKSDLTTGRTTAWKFKAMVDHPTSERLLHATQDGGNCSDLMALSLLTNTERF